MASCSACSVLSSSSVAYGLPNPLDSSRSGRRATRSSRSRSSSSSPVNFVYRYFTRRTYHGGRRGRGGSLLPTDRIFPPVLRVLRGEIMTVTQTHSQLVVVFFLAARDLQLFFELLLLAPRRAPRCGFSGDVAAVVGAAD